MSVALLVRPAYSVSTVTGVERLAEVVENSSYVSRPVDLVLTDGVQASAVLTKEVGRYFIVVLTDLATDECVAEIDQALSEEGIPQWREAIIDIIEINRRHPNFPGSEFIRYMAIHEKALIA
ncbi:hypothetical protein ABWK57_14115 [Streptomyces sp. NPDC094045]|uniref:hypothetical protein n=1 Tax=unclassified Streptomyces TaxID=2593676 RepID=UPI00339A018A